MNPQFLDQLRQMIMQSMQGKMPQATFGFRGPGQMNGTDFQKSSTAPELPFSFPQDRGQRMFAGGTEGFSERNGVQAPVAPAPQPAPADYYGPADGKAQYFANMGLGPDGLPIQQASQPRSAGPTPPPQDPVFGAAGAAGGDQQSWWRPSTDTANAIRGQARPPAIQPPMFNQRRPQSPMARGLFDAQAPSFAGYRR